MIRILSIALFLLCLSAKAQSVQIHGKILFPESDTVNIKVWSDGELVAFEDTMDPFYALILGERPHYVIQFRSGSKIKYCHLICYNMEFENIQADVYFSNGQSLLIYKKRARDKHYIFNFYGSGTTRSAEVPINETE